MYNLLIGFVVPNDTENEIIVSASRFLEYTDSETQMRFRILSSENVGEIKEFPALLMLEHYEDGAFVAQIKNITKSNRDYKSIESMAPILFPALFFLFPYRCTLLFSIESHGIGAYALV